MILKARRQGTDMDEVERNREGFLDGFFRGYEISESLQGTDDLQAERSYGLQMNPGTQGVNKSPIPYREDREAEMTYPRAVLGWGSDTARRDEQIRSKLPKIKDGRVIARADWAAYPPNYAGLEAQSRPYTGIVLHHTGNTDTPKEVEELQRNRQPPLKSVARSVGSALGIAQKYKMDDIGYNFLISRDGTIYEGRSLSLVGAHVRGRNEGNIGIAFLGNYSDDPLSEAAAKSALELMEELRDRYSLGKDGKDFVSFHGNYDHAKKDELHGARDQIWQMKRRLQKREKSESGSSQQR